MLTDDFFSRFQVYNERDMEVLNDRNPTDENMHEAFTRYADECHVALLLVNASFVDPENYSNQYEVPILKERRNNGEVVLIGVRLSNVSDLDEWNDDGDVFFFQITNNDLPNTRSKNSTNQQFLRQFAVYKQVDERDLDDYHDRLRQWLKENIRKKFGDSAIPKSSVLRSNDDTKKILEMMNSSSLIYSLEEKLSSDKAYWDEAGIAPPVSGESYAFWYCLCQADRYGEIQDRLLNWSERDPLKKFRDIYKITKKKNEAVKRLIDNGSSLEREDLPKQLDRLEHALEQASTAVIMAPRKNHFRVKSLLISAIQDLRETFRNIGGSSLGGS